MSISSFEAFKAELESVRAIVASHANKTIREDVVLDRIRLLSRSWFHIVKPLIEPLLKNKNDFLKLSNELERIAQLTSKFSKVLDYRVRLNRAVILSNNLVLFLPPSDLVGEIQKKQKKSVDLFLPEIPDLPLHLVPNAIIGWRNKIESFSKLFPFDKSIFIMIRYREHNDELLKLVKGELKKNDYHGIIASEHKITDDLYNPIACLLACSKGIAIFDKAEKNQEFNPNVAYELGMMHLLGRDCIILKDNSLKSLHTDILMKLYDNYATTEDAINSIRSWIIGDTE